MVLELTRREFLLATAATSLAAIVHVPLDWRFTDEESKTLLIIAKTLFPHDCADDFYQKAVDEIELRCLMDTRVFEVITTGLAGIPKWGDFTNPGSRELVKVLKAIEKSEFYRLVYSETLQALYGSPEAWALFRVP